MTMFARTCGGMGGETRGKRKREEKEGRERGKEKKCGRIKLDRTPLSNQVFYHTVDASATTLSPNPTMINRSDFVHENKSRADEGTP